VSVGQGEGVSIPKGKRDPLRANNPRKKRNSIVEEGMGFPPNLANLSEGK